MGSGATVRAILAQAQVVRDCSLSQHEAKCAAPERTRASLSAVLSPGSLPGKLLLLECSCVGWEHGHTLL